MAAPMATTSSGLTALVGLLAEDVLDDLLDLRHAGRAADQDDLVDLLGLEPGVLQRLLHGGMVRSIRSSTSCSNLARVSVIFRCLGPTGRR